METKRKTDLFRFVTLRSPELISADKRALGFIEHPDGESGFYMDLVAAAANLAAAKSAVLTGTGTFVPFTTVAEIKALSPDTWEFAIWLSQNKNKLVRSELDALIPVSLPDAAEMLELWDNVFHDILTESNENIRQGCLQMLVATNFATNYDTYSPGITVIEEEIAEEARLLRRLANGKVVIHQAFTADKAIPEPSTVGLENLDYSKQEAFHKAKMDGLKLTELEAYKADLVALYPVYEADETTAFNTSYSTYKSTVASTISSVLRQAPKIHGAKNAEDAIPDEAVAAFTFSYTAPLSTAYTTGKLDAATIAYVADNYLEGVSIKEAIDFVDREIETVKRAAGKAPQRKYKEVLVNGVLVRTISDAPKMFSLSFKETTVGEDTYYVGYLSLNAGYTGSFLRNAEFNVIISATTHTTEAPEIISNNTTDLFIKLPFTTLETMPANTEFTFTATFDMNNGKSMQVAKGGITSSLMTSGVMTPVAAEEEVTLYGVQRIGVADFRRVEQELCCYIPGEVSHIENILAKEYKEKSSRNLLRTEVSLETTEEREVEEVSDTVSTTRHELSSEISKIIEKDRSSNFGFSAGASGGINVKWNVSGYGDFTFGQSTTDSNQTAKSYAEEVTRRALERIVHKIAQKRTSKVLQEYEDSIKHGYDNRTGETHVTGVFRWIDKVYKNRIVNYGKRLIYEFLLPEPARFYKDAVIIKAEEENLSPSTVVIPGTGTVAVKPIHPSENGIKSSADLDEANYESMAAIYGASVIPPQENTINIEESFPEAPGNTDQPQSYTYPDKKLQIPPDYRVTNLSGKMTFSFKANVFQGFIKANIGGKFWQYSPLVGVGSFTKPITHDGLNLTGPVSVGINCKQVTSFSLAITAICKLKDSVYKQWQQDTYNSIMSAYQSQLQAFNDSQVGLQASTAMNEAQKAADTKLPVNPLYNALTIRTEIKRICIELMTKPFSIAQGKDFYQNGPCDIPQIKLSSELDTYGKHVKFFEQAFDWDIMSHMFYPYYWAKKCDWKALFQAQDSVDYLFQQFLQSGMGRVLVPVREGYEDAVTYFMETGEVWNGVGLVVDTDDEAYLSMVDETAIPGGSASDNDEWETIVPSSLTLVQARSVLLDDEGLPCCETDEEVIDTLNLQADTNILSGEGEGA